MKTTLKPEAVVEEKSPFRKAESPSVRRASKRALSAFHQAALAAASLQLQQRRIIE